MKDQIRKFLSDSFLDGAGDVTDTGSLFASGIVDSLRLIELIAFVEKTFDISVNMDEVTPGNFDSINNICKLILSKKDRSHGKKNAL